MMYYALDKYVTVAWHQKNWKLFYCASWPEMVEWAKTMQASSLLKQ